MTITFVSDFIESMARKFYRTDEGENHPRLEEVELGDLLNRSPGASAEPIEQTVRDPDLVAVWALWVSSGFQMRRVKKQ